MHQTETSNKRLVVIALGLLQNVISWQTKYIRRSVDEISVHCHCMLSVIDTVSSSRAQAKMAYDKVLLLQQLHPWRPAGDRRDTSDCWEWEESVCSQSHIASPPHFAPFSRLASLGLANKQPNNMQRIDVVHAVVSTSSIIYTPTLCKIHFTSLPGSMPFRGSCSRINWWWRGIIIQRRESQSIEDNSCLFCGENEPIHHLFPGFVVVAAASQM